MCLPHFLLDFKLHKGRSYELLVLFFALNIIDTQASTRRLSWVSYVGTRNHGGRENAGEETPQTIIVGTWEYHPALSVLGPLFSRGVLPPRLLTLDQTLLPLLQYKFEQLMFLGTTLSKSTQLKISTFKFHLFVSHQFLFSLLGGRESPVFVSVP